MQMVGKGKSVIDLDLPLLIDAAFCAGAAMITFGAVLGKVSPTQLMILLLIEVLPRTLYLQCPMHCLALRQHPGMWLQHNMSPVCPVKVSFQLHIC